MLKAPSFATTLARGRTVACQLPSGRKNALSTSTYVESSHSAWNWYGLCCEGEQVEARVFTHEDPMGKRECRDSPHHDSRNREIMGMLSARYFLHETLMSLVEELNGLDAYLNDAPGG